MSKLKLRGKDLRSIGYPEGPVISIAMNIMEKNFKPLSQEDALEILRAILQSPNQYAQEGPLDKIAEALIPKPKTGGEEIPLNKTGVDFNVFGSEFIEGGALQQMQTAAKLPVAVAGALMPDAHAGYGLPIGGVLATENVVIPYGVGVDIGCRMCLSIFDIDPSELSQREPWYKRELDEATLFGAGATFERASDHDVMERDEWNQLGLLQGLHVRAWKQLGSSGSGNHFVEFGTIEIGEEQEASSQQSLGLKKGRYLGLLSHSGSRALGASIANHYTKIAKEKRKLPGEAANLAWLDLSEQDGAEYWMAMNSPTHHNFAWKEIFEGREVIVHRKGATPAGKNVLGIIPGSMTAPGFIVRGKGEPASLSSASHGAGRRMSRTAALNTITHSTLNELLRHHGVTLIGGGLDEAPLAYKDIHSVMNAQKNLVETVGLFYPKIVKMDGAEPKNWKKKKGEMF